MKTLEFFTKIKNGMIKIPDKHNDIKDNEVKVILHWEETHYQKKNILSALSKIQKKNIFREIKDPSDWQRTIRNEW